jgi:hypothetical protein
MINLLSHRLSGASTSDRCHDRPSSSLHLDQLISEDGTVTIEQPIMPVEEATIHHFLLSHLHLLPRCYQDRTNQPHQALYQQYPGLWLLVGLGCLRLRLFVLVALRKAAPPVYI